MLILLSFQNIFLIFVASLKCGYVEIWAGAQPFLFHKHMKSKNVDISFFFFIGLKTYICKVHPNLLNMMPFILIRFFFFAFFSNSNPSFVHFCVCISLTGHWWVVHTYISYTKPVPPFYESMAKLSAPNPMSTSKTFAVMPGLHFSMPHFLRVVNTSGNMQQLVITAICIKWSIL